jgi:hypothetical protein
MAHIQQDLIPKKPSSQSSIPYSEGNYKSFSNQPDSPGSAASFDIEKHDPDLNEGALIRSSVRFEPKPSQLSHRGSQIIPDVEKAESDNLITPVKGSAYFGNLLQNNEELVASRYTLGTTENSHIENTPPPAGFHDTTFAITPDKPIMQKALITPHKPFPNETPLTVRYDYGNQSAYDYRQYPLHFATVSPQSFFLPPEVSPFQCSPPPNATSFQYTPTHNITPGPSELLQYSASTAGIIAHNFWQPSPSPIQANHFYHVSSLSQPSTSEIISAKVDSSNSNIMQQFISPERTNLHQTTNFSLSRDTPEKTQNQSISFLTRFSKPSVRYAKDFFSMQQRQLRMKTPMKDPSLHIFTNAVKNLSPPVFGGESVAKFVEEQNNDGSVFKGEKFDQFKHGRGVLVYADGSKFDGEWEEDIKTGYGKLYNAEAELVYEGEWENDTFHGNGILYNVKKSENDFEVNRNLGEALRTLQRKDTILDNQEQQFQQMEKILGVGSSAKKPYLEDSAQKSINRGSAQKSSFADSAQKSSFADSAQKSSFAGSVRKSVQESAEKKFGESQRFFTQDSEQKSGEESARELIDHYIQSIKLEEDPKKYVNGPPPTRDLDEEIKESHRYKDSNPLDSMMVSRDDIDSEAFKSKTVYDQTPARTRPKLDLLQPEPARERGLTGSRELHSPLEKIGQSLQELSMIVQDEQPSAHRSNELLEKVRVHINTVLRTVFQNWLRYEGEFVHKSKNGMGALFFKDNYRFTGMFRNNFIDGIGSIYLPDGNSVTGEWQCNELVKII